VLFINELHASTDISETERTQQEPPPSFPPLQVPYDWHSFAISKTNQLAFVLLELSNWYKKFPALGQVSPRVLRFSPVNFIPSVPITRKNKKKTDHLSLHLHHRVAQ
jgi:hypothetical protein